MVHRVNTVTLTLPLQLTLTVPHTIPHIGTKYLHTKYHDTIQHKPHTIIENTQSVTNRLTDDAPDGAVGMCACQSHSRCLEWS